MEVGAGTQLVHIAFGAGLLHRPGQGGQVLVGGEGVCGRQVAPGEGSGAGRLAGCLHPGVFQRFFFTAFRRGGVRGDHRAAHRGPQLPGGLHLGLLDDQRFDGGGVLIIQPGQLVGDHGGAALVDQPGQRRAGQREPVQAQRQGEDAPRAVPGHGERGGDLVFGVLERPPVPARPPFSLTPGRQLRHGGEQPGDRAGTQPLPCRQHPSQLIIIQAAQALLPHLVRERGEHRPRWHRVHGPAVPESRPRCCNGGVVTADWAGQVGRPRLTVGRFV